MLKRPVNHIFAKETCEPKNHLITFIMVTGTVDFVYSSPLVNDKHVRKSGQRPGFILEELSSRNSFTPTISQFCVNIYLKYLNLKGKKPRCYF